MALNPLAAEFVPSARRKPIYLAYTGWGRDGKSSRQESQQIFDLDPGEGANNFNDLPKEVVGTIFSKLEDPADVLAAALVNKSLMRTASEAALHLRVRAQHLQIPNHSFLQAAYQIFPGIVELKLCGCPAVEDEHIVTSLSRLPCLRFLDLSACRKLSSSFPGKVLSAFSEAQQHLPDSDSSRRGLQVLGLQRCFQLDAFALTDVVRAAAGSNSSLAVVTLSHLSLERWPPLDHASRPSKLLRVAQDIPRMPAAHSVACASLRILALHNSKNIAADSLAYLAACCPDLEMLLLGGSSLDIPVRSPEDGQGDAGHGEGLQALGPQILWGVSNLDGFYRRCTAALVDAAQSLSKLQVLELTFFFPQLVANVAAQLPDVQVWDFTLPASLDAAEKLWRQASQVENGSGIRLALSAAANCSSNVRHTPLHAAVDGDCKYIKVLLDLGGQLEARDQTGATALFLACENNKLGCAKMLLRAGAEVRVKNLGGEAPLYIAALRGHDAIVEELLSTFKARGLSWTESQLYGDRWNPLMAAAVGDRHSTAVQLLRAAGPEAESLVLATNRFGQSVSHIAARKGSRMLLRSLVDAAGGFVALMPDNDGKTPLQVAHQYRQEGAINLLTQAASAFKAGWAKGSAPSELRRKHRVRWEQRSDGREPRLAQF